MTRPIEEQRELCARFVGWVLLGNYWRDENSNCMFRWDKYRPDENIEQANELLKWLDNIHGVYIAITSAPIGSYQWSARINHFEYPDRAFTGGGETWTAAVTAAVADLRASIEERKG